MPSTQPSKRKGRPKMVTKHEGVSITLPPEILKKARSMANKSEMSLSAYVSRLLENAE